MEILRYSAFSTTPTGGNPAGVVLNASGVGDETMLSTAAEIGFSETAFLFPRDDGDFTIRYFSPLMEVPFCGHATVATAVAYAQRHGAGLLRLHTKAGLIPVSTTIAADDSITATLTSVAPKSAPISAENLAELLAALRWSADELDSTLPPRVAFAGAWHPIIAAESRGRLSHLDYDRPRLTELMRSEDWATIDLVYRESPLTFHARNPFPIGGVVEDPATGAAAAAFGGYLREFGLISTPSKIFVHQGYDMGRPSTITVTIPSGADTGIQISGTAVSL